MIVSVPLEIFTIVEAAIEIDSHSSEWVWDAADGSDAVICFEGMDGWEGTRSPRPASAAGSYRWSAGMPRLVESDPRR